MAEFKCSYCKSTLLQATEAFYVLSEGLACAEHCNTMPSSLRFDLSGDRPITTLKKVFQELNTLEGEDWSATMRIFWQQVIQTFEARLEELRQSMRQSPAIENPAESAAAEQTTSDSHDAIQSSAQDFSQRQCQKCKMVNTTSSQICSQCEASATAFSPTVLQIPVGKLDLDALTTVDHTESGFWTCPKCKKEQIPMSNPRCSCGFVNLALVSSDVGPEPEQPIAQDFPVGPNPYWKCACSYEYNQQADRSCQKCSTPRPTETKPAYSGINSGSLQSPAKVLPQTLTPDAKVWPCVCGYEYNLIENETCLKCAKANPYWKPKCRTCRTREVAEKGQECDQCTRSKSPLSATAHWMCACICHLPNSITQKCSSCRCAQTPITNNFASSPKIEEKKNPVSVKGTWWSCSCGYNLTPKNSKICSNCKQPSPQAPLKQAWRCCKCNFREVEEEGRSCPECLQRYGYSNTYWRCVTCQVNSNKGDVCRQCGKSQSGAENQHVPVAETSESSTSHSAATADTSRQQFKCYMCKVAGVDAFFKVCENCNKQSYAASSSSYNSYPAYQSGVLGWNAGQQAGQYYK